MGISSAHTESCRAIIARRVGYESERACDAPVVFSRPICHLRIGARFSSVRRRTALEEPLIGRLGLRATRWCRRMRASATGLGRETHQTAEKMATVPSICYYRVNPPVHVHTCRASETVEVTSEVTWAVSLELAQEQYGPLHREQEKLHRNSR